MTRISQSRPSCQTLSDWLTSELRQSPRQSSSSRAGMTTESLSSGAKEGAESTVVFYYRNVSWFNNGFCRASWKGIFAVMILLAAAAAGTGCDRGDHPAQVGMAAPDFTVHDQGQTVSLDQYRGKTVVLNFWASWCAPCIEELPSLINLQKQMPQIVVVAVDFNDEESSYRQFITDNHIDLLTIRDASQKSNLAFGTTRPPETYIIDAQGRIRRKFIGAQDWTSSEIENYLRNL